MGLLSMVSSLFEWMLFLINSVHNTCNNTANCFTFQKKKKILLIALYSRIAKRNEHPCEFLGQLHYLLGIRNHQSNFFIFIKLKMDL